MNTKKCTRCLRTLPIISNDWYSVHEGKTRRTRCKKCFVQLEQDKGWAKHSVNVHRTNDRNRGLYISEKHITVDFLMRQFNLQGGRCMYPDCNIMLSTETPRYAKNSLSVERLSNYCGHSCDNVVLICRECQKRNKRTKQSCSSLDKLVGLDFPRVTSRHEFRKIKQRFSRAPSFV